MIKEHPVDHGAIRSGRTRPVNERRKLVTIIRHIELQTDADLMKVAQTTRRTRGFFRAIQPRDHQSSQDCDDGDYHQEFQQGECALKTGAEFFERFQNPFIFN